MSKSKPKATERIPCGHCQGCGTLPLAPVFAETLANVRRLCGPLTPGYIVANRDARYFGCKPTALNNRLAHLERYGFVRSDRVGKQRRFYLLPAKAKRGSK